MDADHVKIGTVVSKHGYKGSIKVKLLSTELKRIPEVDFIFIDIDECFIPYKVVSLKTLNDNSAIFKLRELNSEGEVAEVILKDVYVNKKYSKMLPQESFFFNELIDFIVFKDSHEIGKIVSVNSNLPQPVFEVLINKKKFMIPIHNDFIEKIDRENKHVHLVIPDGLLEII
tara:strand:+ start:65 stop:580 length:516 start_codon:yes stop_codon:yes gene_type:complete